MTDGMSKATDLTPAVKGLPPWEDSQPMPWTCFVEAVQLAHKGSPYLTAAFGGFIVSGQGELG